MVGGRSFGHIKPSRLLPCCQAHRLQTVQFGQIVNPLPTIKPSKKDQPQRTRFRPSRDGSEGNAVGEMEDPSCAVWKFSDQLPVVITSVCDHHTNYRVIKLCKPKIEFVM